MKKQLAIVLGVSLAAGAAVANNEGEYTEPETSMDTTAETSLDTGVDTGLDTGVDTGTATATNFADLDVNQDSLISEQEATDSQLLDSEAFASADSNQDGYLSQTEFDARSDVGQIETETEIESEPELDDAS